MNEQLTGKASTEHIPEIERIRTNIREQIDLRLKFAEAIAERKAMSLGDAVSEFTDLRQRLMTPPATEGMEDIEAYVSRWRQVMSEIDEAPSHTALLKRLAELYERADEKRPDRTSEEYWPFSYDYVPSEESVYLHFGQMRFAVPDSSQEPGLLALTRMEEQRAVLKRMFREIRDNCPAAKRVRGGSWLHTLPAYRRLYPESYGKNYTVRTGKFTGGGRWGQFLTRDGSVNKKLRDQFLANIEHLDVEHLHKAFPIETRVVEAPIEDFYKEYGIER